MSTGKRPHLTPVERAGAFESPLRRRFQNPFKILKPYIKKGMTVLDLGCGPGFFSIELAKLLDGSGKVIAADLQQGMLERVRQKINGTELEQLIKLHKCYEESINLTDKVDFVLAFYTIHEVSHQDNLFKELKSILKPGGEIFIIEPKFHVPRQLFNDTVNKMIEIGFEITERPKVFLSRAVLMRMKTK